MGRLTYLGMLLPWALVVVGLQWALGHAALRHRLRLLGLATLIPTAYLVAADSLALSQGIWTIHAERIIGWRLGNVPIEECLFFLATNLMVAQSLILFNAPELRERLARLVQRRRGRHARALRGPG